VEKEARLNVVFFGVGGVSRAGGAGSLTHDPWTSYIDLVGQMIGRNDVELAVPQDTGKTLGD
jgi:hypothetical protein